MKHFALRLLAAASLLVASALAATRPHYGGTLRVLLRNAPASLNAADLEQAGVDGRNIARLLYDALVVLDDRGIPQPGLAISWQSDPSSQRWQFSLRSGVTFSDGTPLTAEAVAAALRISNPTWRVSADAEEVVIQLDSPNADLTAELALVRNCIIARHDGGKVSGTGPFAVTQWQAGRKLTLAARDDYWHGRPFLSSIEIDLMKSQLVDLRRYDVAEIAPDQARKAGAGGGRTETSAPSDLLALAFTKAVTGEEGKVRDALSLSIDRKVLNEVVLQDGGDPARGLLPGWLTGYDFLFSSEINLPQARQAMREVTKIAPLTLAYDSNDPSTRLIAERIALNAADAGIKLVLTTGMTPDVRLVRLNLSSLNPQLALIDLAEKMGMATPTFKGNSSEELYAAERALLQSQRVIPLVHLKTGIALSGAIQNWTNSSAGDWHLPDVWLDAEKP